MAKSLSVHSFGCLTVFLEAGCHFGKSPELWTHLSPDVHNTLIHVPPGKNTTVRLILSARCKNKSQWTTKVIAQSGDKLGAHSGWSQLKSNKFGTKFPLNYGKNPMYLNERTEGEYKCLTRLLTCCLPSCCCCCGDMLSIQPPDALRLTMRLSSGDAGHTEIPLISSVSGGKKPCQHTPGTSPRKVFGSPSGARTWKVTCEEEEETKKSAKAKKENKLCWSTDISPHHQGNSVL